MGMSLRSRMAQPLKLGHAITALAAAIGVIWGAAEWMGMPKWGPGVANAQMTARLDTALRKDDSVLVAQSLRDAAQDLVSMTLDARLDTVQTTTEATLRLVCIQTTREQQYLAKVRC